jgi:DNA-binding CsgD family transcriptional regulator
MSNVDWLKDWTEMVSSADTVAELGKKLVHSQLTASEAVGTYFFLLNSRGVMELLGGYGINPINTEPAINAWDDHILANSIKNKGLAKALVDYQGNRLYCYAIPMLKGSEPLGSAMFCQKAKPAEDFPAEVNYAMSQVLGIWLQSMGLANGFNPNSKQTEPNPQALTERQLKILERMSFGQTNAEIAQELILSESSIRQETVKIYRALGVGSRAEAVKRAIHLGILRAQAI